nr:acetyltransferase [Actinomycetota bacterium]
ALGAAVVRAEQPENPVYLSKKAIHTVMPQNEPEQTVEKKSTNNSIDKNIEKEKQPGEKKEPEKSKALADKDKGSGGSTGRVTAVGDSVMLGAAKPLKKELDNLEVMDAAVGLYPMDAIEILRSRSASGELGDTVIIHVGENGPFSAKEFDEMMEILGDRRVVFVNIKVPRAWETPNNEVLAEGTREYPNASLVDWYSVGAAHPEYFWDDGIHLRPRGATAYANLISKSLRESATT